MPPAHDCCACLRTLFCHAKEFFRHATVTQSARITVCITGGRGVRAALRDPSQQTCCVPHPENAMNDTFFITGRNAASRRSDSYIVRHADEELLDGLRQGEFCYVLNTRQMGKSSLMARAALPAKSGEGVSVVILDLTAIGQNLTVEQWYAGLLARVGQQTATGRRAARRLARAPRTRPDAAISRNAAPCAARAARRSSCHRFQEASDPAATVKQRERRSDSPTWLSRARTPRFRLPFLLLPASSAFFRLPPNPSVPAS